MDLQHQALFSTSEAFGVEPGEVAQALLLDLRRSPAYAAASQTLPGARWYDPEQLDGWLPALAGALGGRRLVVYCVHGHEVSRGAVLRLRAAGLDAYFLRGGFEAWRAAGRPLADKPAPR